MRKIEYTVSGEYDNVPLYFFLKEYAGVSTRIIQTLRHTEKSVFINGKESRVVDKVRNGDAVSFFLPEKRNSQVVIDQNGAEALECPGEFIAKFYSKAETFHVIELSDLEIQKILKQAE